MARLEVSILLALFVFAASAVAQPSHPSLFWDSILRKDILASSQGVGSSILSIAETARVAAIMHGSIFDAYSCYIPLGNQIFNATSCTKNGSGTSALVASHAAAAEVLKSLFPSNASYINTTLTSVVASVAPSGDGAALDVGTAFGAFWITERNGDGFSTVTNYPGSLTPGKWRNFPDASAPWTSGGPATAAPLTMRSHSQFRVAAPIAISNVNYTQHVTELKNLGAAQNSARTAADAQILTYWMTVNNIDMWFDAASTLVTIRALPTANATILFTMLAFGQYDSVIASSDSKLFYSTWRPRTAIAYFNLSTDATWSPVVASDSTPEYPSATASIGMVSAKILINYFKAENGVNITVSGRSWTRPSAAAAEEGYSKVLEGVHFRFSVEAGLSQGSNLADYIYTTVFGLGAATPVSQVGAPTNGRNPRDEPTPGTGISAMGAVGIAVMIIIFIAVVFALIFFCTPLKRKLCPPTTVE